MEFVLTSQLLQECRDVFKQCDQFESDSLLRAVFNTDKLRPFRLRLPIANSINDRIELCINYLTDCKLQDESPVIPIFVENLRDSYEAGDGLRQKLDLLLSHLNKHLDSLIANSQTQSLAVAQALPNLDKVALREFMVNNFTTLELQDLCLYLSGALNNKGYATTIDLDLIGGSTRPQLVLNLILFCERRGWYDELVKQVRATDQGRSRRI